MTNEQETIDGVKGEWRTVTRPSEVKVGQRVRYDWFGKTLGVKEARIITGKESGIKSNGSGPFVMSKENGYTNIQAFFPLPVRESRKVVKVRIFTSININKYWFETKVIQPIESRLYSKRSHAIRGAKRFCIAIGYECEIVK